MTVPTQATYSVEALTAANEAFRDLLDAGTGAGSIRIYEYFGTQLAEIPLTYPCGTINGSTGQLTITPDGRDDAADDDGQAAYAEFCDGDGVVHLSLPAQAGSTAVSGYIVINTLTIVAGGPVEVLSVTIG